MKITHDPDPGPMRKKEYPSIGDQLDAIWKIVTALLSQDVPPEAAIQVLDAVQAVKAKYGKKK